MVILDEVIKGAKSYLMAEGDHPPIFFYYNGDRTFIYKPDFESTITKHNTQTMSLMVAYALDAKESYFISEAWVLRTSNHEDIEKEIRDHPDAKEAIQILHQKKGEKPKHISFEIVRDDEGDIKGLKERDAIDYDEVGGRFSYLIPDRLKEHNPIQEKISYEIRDILFDEGAITHDQIKNMMLNLIGVFSD